MPSKVENLDKNMQVQAAGTDLAWRDIRDFGVEGRGWNPTQKFYDRLPAHAQGQVPAPVWELAKRSSGMACRFVTDSAIIAARWKLRFDQLSLWHMPSTGVSGIDLYARTGDETKGQWRWAGISRDIQYPISTSNLAEGLDSHKRQYMMYLPLYNGVEKVEIGVAPQAALEPAPQRLAEHQRPICFYGTSILQGASAARPGMAHASILGRRLDREIINLGFSGNGKMEIQLAGLLGEIDAAVYVIDCLPNMTDELVDERLIPFATRLRAMRPTAPLVFVDSLIYMDSPIKPSRYRRCYTSNRAQRRALDQLQQTGMTNLYHVPGELLTADDGEAAVDGTHLTDLGFMRMADVLEPVLRKVL